MRGVVRVLVPLAAAVVFFIPTVSYAQVGNIAGIVKDTQGAAVPGVTVEVTSPVLIEKVRATQTDNNGRYQIVSLPVGTYKVSFTLSGFTKVEQSGITTSSDFTNTVNAELKPGNFKEVVTVKANTVEVDTTNAKQLKVFTGDEIKDLPTSRNLSDLYQLVPGISLGAAGPNDAPRICSGGVADPTGTFFNAGSSASGSKLGGGGFGASGFNGAFSGSTSGSLSGCGPTIENFNAHTGMSDGFGLSQGRVQLDGMGIQSFGGGGASAYVADIANAQEISFTLSGALGESETGGTTINIIPRTGGNRYAGNFFTSYGDHKFFDKNNGTRTSSFNNRLDYQYDVNASYGGPIVKDRLWFQGNIRRQDRQNILRTSYRNLNEGKYGLNYVGDPTTHIMQSDRTQNASLRLTLQATQRDKFNIFWDEQYTCQNPCKGTAGANVSVEASPSQVAYPLHVAQLSWSNPLTNRILLDAGVSSYLSKRSATRNRYNTEYPDIPTIVEDGTTIQTVSAGFGSMTSGSINNTTGARSFNLQSRASASYVTGSHNVKLGYQGGYLTSQSHSNFNNPRLEYFYQTPNGPCNPLAPNVNAVSGAGTIWCGLMPDGRREYDGRQPNDTVGLLCPTTFNATLAGACPAGFEGTVVELPLSSPFVAVPLTTDANTSLRQLASNARMNYLATQGYVIQQGTTFNGLLQTIPNYVSLAPRIPVPRTVTQFVDYPLDENVWFGGLYLQDQWTWNRLTLNGALRYDLARSSFRKTCVADNLYVPTELNYCLNDGGISGTGKGVDFQDLTPRWGVAWDVFGNGRTALKWNMGKYVGGANVGGIYTAMNPAGIGRSNNSYSRGWLDIDGDRRVDCDLTVPIVAPPSGTSFPTNGECGGEETGNATFGVATANASRFARDPYDFTQAQSDIQIGTQSFYCGQPSVAVREDGSILRLANQRVINYCDNYAAEGGKGLVSGFGRRAYTWQLGIGVQHEILPRLTAEVTYSRNWTGNRVIADSITTVPQAGQPYVPNGCDLYSVNVGEPSSNEQCAADLLNHISPYYNFYGILAPVDARLPGGGGYIVEGNAVAKATQTPTNVTVNTIDIHNRIKNYSHYVDTNFSLRARGGLRLSGGTSTGRSVSNTCGALVDNPPSVVIREGTISCDGTRPFQTNVRGNASYTIPWVDVLLSTSFSYRPGTRISANYSTNAANVIWDPNNPNATTTGTVTTNLLGPNHYGEGIRLFDIRLAKNLRFGNTRVNVGADLYNAFNSDAAISYCLTFPNCGTVGATTYQDWQQVSNVTTPRYARFQIQFDF